MGLVRSSKQATLSTGETEIGVVDEITVDQRIDWIEHCDVCGRELDPLKSEDFYIDTENKVLCEKHYEEWRRAQDGRNDQSNR